MFIRTLAIGESEDSNPVEIDGIGQRLHFRLIARQAINAKLPTWGNASTVKPSGVQCQRSNDMTDRDTFAAAALTGLLADDGDRIDHAMTDFTRRSYEWADAMLREREGVACEPKPTLTDDTLRKLLERLK